MNRHVVQFYPFNLFTSHITSYFTNYELQAITIFAILMGISESVLNSEITDNHIITGGSMAKKNITFADIAKYTNFSKTTISRYFNNPDSLTPENQQIISDALIALDYKENKLARTFANGKTEFIGIIVPNLHMHYYAQILNELLAII